MARGGHNSPETALPKVQFEEVNDEAMKLPAGVHESAFRSYGYNDFSEFRKPDHYIRHIEPLESDLAKTVEYDMDEQDQEWLDAVNAGRKKEQIDQITYETFEIIMDRLEKEWFDLTKNLQKTDLAMPSEDSTCAVCDDSEGENSNAIVFCDGCNLAVHQDCYGVPYIPEGQWLCRKCTVSPESAVSCVLCPNEGGAFKQTTNGEWIHLLCAIWIPETRVVNEVFMEPISGVERISKQRWKLRCSICDSRDDGACIQCAKSTCFLAFHTTCARKEKLLLPMKSVQGAENVTLTCYCERHLPREQQEIRAAALAAMDSDDRPQGQGASKSARAYAKTYKLGPPLVPAIVVDRIMQYIYRIKIRKKVEFIHLMCKYWSLKREARRGAPLLKRLYLEPWSNNNAAKVLSDEEKRMRLEQLQRIRQDLTHVHTLTDLCRKREVRKMRQAEVICDVLSQALYPHHAPFRLAFERIMAIDRQDHFKNPVSKTEVPDYFDIVKNPMCWSQIDAKLDQHQYWNVSEFKDDIELVLNNAMLYNKPGTTFHKLATRIQKEARPLLDDLERLKTHHPKPIPNGEDNMDVDVPMPGDLEPSLDILNLLTSSEIIKADLNIELDTDPISSLFNYELARIKPIPPTPPPVKKPKKTKQKRDRRAEQERARINREAREAAAAVETATTPQAEGTLSVEPDRQASAIPVTVEEDRTARALQTEHDASAAIRVTRNRAAAAVAQKEELPSSPTIDVPPALEPSISHSSSGKPHSHRRHSSTLVGPAAVPRVVNDVDNRDSFSMFHAGWILPPDQKRHGRSQTERSGLPPPKKKQKTGETFLHGTSRLSIVSTAPSENQTLKRSVSVEVKQNPDDENDAMHLGSVHHPGGSASRGMSMAVDEDIDVPHNVVTQPNGVVIIEKLDTPAIRRERNMRRKAEKRKMMQEQAEEHGTGMEGVEGPDVNISTGSSAPSSAHEKVALDTGAGAKPTSSASNPGPTAQDTVPIPQDIMYTDFESELSDLSDSEEEEEETHDRDEKDDDDTEDEVVEGSGATGGDVKQTKGKTKAPPPEPQKASGSKKKKPPSNITKAPVASTSALSAPPITRSNKSKAGDNGTLPRKRVFKDDLFVDSTLVWAKSDLNPWWPAVIHGDDNPAVPEDYLAIHKDRRQKRKIKLFIVHYYNRSDPWGSVSRDKLCLLGEDDAVDQEMLTSASKQKWKPSATQKACREAYRCALANMDADDEKQKFVMANLSKLESNDGDDEGDGDENEDEETEDDHTRGATITVAQRQQETDPEDL
ncbi:hypothetical protein CVT24_011406 [Panaeolus cyanescens]|uniref:Histone acetyltransferase n=1 Tax=Panaeolus cyanescens TaxID=181874 RepID=A0A409VG85_9AGAR|nr:hypothetical protein CVT24_011406 [Panaeolus cyanescens]